MPKMNPKVISMKDGKVSIGGYEMVFFAFPEAGLDICRDKSANSV